MSVSSRPALALRLTACALIAFGGYIHILRYTEGYKSVPNIGTMFLVNGIVSFVLAGAFAVWSRWQIAAAAVLVQLGSLAGFALSRSVGFFNFMETDFGREAAASVAAEVAALVALAVFFTIVAQNRARLIPARTRG